MKARTIPLVVLLTLFGTFLLVNWRAFTAPTDLSLVFGTVQAPLGLVLLAVIVLICGAFLLLIALQQASLMMEMRRAAQELARQRAIADEAEQSRFTELRRHLDDELRRFETRAGAHNDAVIERLDMLESALRIHIEETGNSIAASVGEIDDHVEKLAVLSQPVQQRDNV